MSLHTDADKEKLRQTVKSQAHELEELGQRIHSQQAELERTQEKAQHYESELAKLREEIRQEKSANLQKDEQIRILMSQLREVVIVKASLELNVAIKASKDPLLVQAAAKINNKSDLLQLDLPLLKTLAGKEHLDDKAWEAIVQSVKDCAIEHRLELEDTARRAVPPPAKEREAPKSAPPPEEQNQALTKQLKEVVHTITKSYKGSDEKRETLMELWASVNELSQRNHGNLSKSEIQNIFRLLTNITLQKQADYTFALIHRNTTTSGEQLRTLINQPQFKDLKQFISNPEGSPAFSGEVKYRNLRGIASKGSNEALMDNAPFKANNSNEVASKFSSFKKQIAELKGNDSDEELRHGNTSGL